MGNIVAVAVVVGKGARVEADRLDATLGVLAGVVVDLVCVGPEDGPVD